MNFYVPNNKIMTASGYDKGDSKMIMNLSGKTVYYRGDVLPPRMGVIDDYKDKLPKIRTIIISEYMVESSRRDDVHILVATDEGLTELNEFKQNTK